MFYIYFTFPVTLLLITYKNVFRLKVFIKKNCDAVDIKNYMERPVL